MDRYAVVGNPVAHSLSPRIHAAFAAATGQTLTYGKLTAPLGGFERTVEEFFAGGGAGLNVTVPFKEQAAGWVTELHGNARLAGVVNTIVRMAGGYAGHNTDGAGLVQDLVGNLGVTLAGARLLLLGAGGAARGVAGPLLAEQPDCLVIANRTEERAVRLADRLSRELQGIDVRAVALFAVTPGFDVIINATSAGLRADGGVPVVAPAVLRDATCYDMIYASTGGSADTAFCRFAAGHGARRVADGFGMLVEQAALAFELWRGVKPETRPVLELLRGPG